MMTDRNLNCDAQVAESDLARKEALLFERLRALQSVVVAFSGGADSAFLAWASHRVLGAQSLAVTALSPSFSAHDRQMAEGFAREVSLQHEFIETAEVEDPAYAANGPDRCYHCKDELFSKLGKLRDARGFSAVIYGLNSDDLCDFRPGHRAASEHAVVAPLQDAGLAKSEIRELSRRAGLSTWDRPASACLASRVPYGIVVTADVLRRVERAESALRELGFRQFRVRAHGDLARIEIAPEEFSLALRPEVAKTFSARLHAIGFTFVTLDLDGYRQGSLNAALAPPRPT